jgi:hypothetical protein
VLSGRGHAQATCGLLLVSSGTNTANATHATKPILPEFAVFSFWS